MRHKRRRRAGATPLPNPPPQGGRERAELAAPPSPHSADDEHAALRRLIDVTKLWRLCPQRRCRREQRCAVPGTPCEPLHRDGYRQWVRRVYIPFLRKRWPTVHWGAPAGQVERELAGAQAAEAAGAATPHATRKRRRRSPRRRGRKAPAAAAAMPVTC